MKSLSSNLKAHLSSEMTTLATCWKLTRRDRTVMGFTDHDADLVVDTVTYMATTGFTPTAVSSSSALNVDNLDVEGILDASAITEEDLMAGIYDHAEIEVFQVNYMALEDGTLPLRIGWLGEVRFNDGRFVAEVRGLTQRLSQRIGDLYSPSCRAAFADGGCKLDIANFTVTGSVTGVTSNRIFQDSTRTESAGIFAGGVITFTSGANDGISMEVKAFSNTGITTVLPLPYEVSIGDQYSLTQGCDKRFSTCVERYNNAINFRGEPHVPGLDRILETSATRSIF